MHVEGQPRTYHIWRCNILPIPRPLPIYIACFGGSGHKGLEVSGSGYWWCWLRRFSRIKQIQYSTMYIRSRENKYFEILKYIEIFNYLSRYTSCTFKEFCPQITEISCSITHIRKYCERVLSVSCPEEVFFIQPAFTAEKDFTCSHYCIYRKMGQRPGRRANPSLGVIQKYEGERQECGSGSGGIRMIRIRIMNMWVRILESILFGCFCKLNLLKATTVKTIKAREKNI